ncbi:MAG: hypothetical protein BGO31_04380 [Bacteroidetes bacterium 43-16]|nr:MAG: hypothetical protein BGO31_04380 [Bacteroidetes bacterium 43-16]
MKKLILTLSAGLLVLSTHAQQGSWYVGGNAGYSVMEQKTGNNGIISRGPKTSSWSFSPELGTFLSDNFQLGAALTFAGTKYETQNAGSYVNKSNMTGGTIYGRYFFGEGIFRPFVGINVTVLPGLGTQSDSSNTVITKIKTMDLGANLNAGFALALSSRVTAVGSFGAVGYSKSTSQEEGSAVKSIQESFGFSNAGTLGQRFNVGIYYTFLK